VRYWRDVVAAALVAVILMVMVWVTEALTTPCPTEDSQMCTWNAQKQGNGQGESFTDWLPW